MQPLVGSDTPRYRQRRRGANLTHKVYAFSIFRPSPEYVRRAQKAGHELERKIQVFWYVYSHPGLDSRVEYGVFFHCNVVDSLPTTRLLALGF
jgi:hypothetical protein